MSTSRVQVKRTSVNDSPPTDLLPGELSVEMGTPTRLWVGVPTSADPSKKKKLVDTSEQHAPLVHTHPITDVTNLQTALDGKANSVHRHTIADIDNLRTELDTIEAGTNANHNHQIGQVLGLQMALDGKSNTNHAHDFSQITGTLPPHTHAATADITGLGALAYLNSIDNAHINPNTVTTPAIVDGAVTTPKIADKTITGDKIADYTITGLQVSSHTINNHNIAPGVITNFHIADNGINGSKIELGHDTTGDLMVYNGTDWSRLPAGNAGQVLQSVGPGAIPVWTSQSTLMNSVQIAGQFPIQHTPISDVSLIGGPYSALRVGYKATNNSSGATMNINVQVFDGTTWGAAIPLASVLNAKTAEFWIYNTGTTNTPVLYALDIMDDRPDSIPTGVTTLLRFTYGTVTSFKLQVKIVGYK